MFFGDQFVNAFMQRLRAKRSRYEEEDANSREGAGGKAHCRSSISGG
jgi:hypothetical protein